MRNNPIFYCQAINKLRPGAGFGLDGTDYDSLKFADETVVKPSKEEIEFEYDIIQNDFDTKEYQRLRAAEYPSFADQFDILYHDGYDAWKEAIKSVKDKYPKP